MVSINFNIDHPKAKEVIEKWTHTIAPQMKDKPALFSVCLSNEPVYSESGRNPQSKPLWAEYLKKQHATTQAVNELYGTKYSSFDEVPVPPIGFPKEQGARRVYYDWVRFNQQHFADWQTKAARIPVVFCSVFRTLSCP